MKKYFLKYFLGILSIAILIIIIQSGSMFLRYKIGWAAWRKDIYETCISAVENNLKHSPFPDLEIDGQELMETLARDNRVSGFLVRDNDGAVILTAGQTPDGKMLASFMNPDKIITEGIPVKSKRKMTVLNASFDPTSIFFAIDRKKTSTEKSETFVPKDIRANDIIGTIQIAFEGNPFFSIDILTYSPRTYIYSKQIIDPIVRSLSIGFPLCLLVAFAGAWLISSRNAKYINSVRIALKNLSQGKDNVSIKETYNRELSDISLAIKDLDKSLQASKKSRNAWLNSISHDLNTPATAMQMIIDGLNDKVFTADNQTLQNLKSENDNLIARIAKVIDYSTLIAETKANLSEINTEDLTAELDNRIHLALNCESVVCDRKLMSKAIEELIKNTNGSPTTMTIEQTESDYLIKIENKGELSPNISGDIYFEPWSRGDSSRSNGGNGLGLPIVAAVAELHNGKAELQQKGEIVCASIKWPIQNFQSNI